MCLVPMVFVLAFLSGTREKLNVPKGPKLEGKRFRFILIREIVFATCNELLERMCFAILQGEINFLV